MINAIWRSCANYYNDIPSDIFPTVGKSALYSFAANILQQGGMRIYGPIYIGEAPLTVNMFNPFYNAGVATLSSLIYSLTTPIFNKIFRDNRIQLHREFLKDTINITGTYMIINYLKNSKMDLIITIALTALSSNFCKSFLECCYLHVGGLIMDPAYIQFLRDEMNKWGLLPTPGSGSIFITY